MSVFLQGLAVGFGIAVPVGPVSALCIARTIREGRLAGLASGLGAASADALCGGVAALGLAALPDIWARHDVALRLVGGFLLCGLGARIALSEGPQDGVAIKKATLARAYAATFLLTVLNPVTVLSFSVVLAACGMVAASASAPSLAPLVAGVFSGSLLWWLLLSGGAARLRARLDVRRLRWVNRAAGILLAGCGMLLLSPIG